MVNSTDSLMVDGTNPFVLSLSEFEFQQILLSIGLKDDAVTQVVTTFTNIDTFKNFYFDTCNSCDGFTTAICHLFYQENSQNMISTRCTSWLIGALFILLN